MFIMKWETFEKICEFVFKVLEELERRYNITNNIDWQEHMKHTHIYAEHKNNDILYQSRQCGFIAERLVTLWILYNIPKEKIVYHIRCKISIVSTKKFTFFTKFSLFLHYFYKRITLLPY